jgi:hypothetical protein
MVCEASAWSLRAWHKWCKRHAGTDLPECELREAAQAEDAADPMMPSLVAIFRVTGHWSRRHRVAVGCLPIKLGRTRARVEGYDGASKPPIGMRSGRA